MFSRIEHQVGDNKIITSFFWQTDKKGLEFLIINKGFLTIDQIYDQICQKEFPFSTQQRDMAWQACLDGLKNVEKLFQEGGWIKGLGEVYLDQFPADDQAKLSETLSKKPIIITHGRKINNVFPSPIDIKSNEGVILLAKNCRTRLGYFQNRVCVPQIDLDKNGPKIELNPVDEGLKIPLSAWLKKEYLNGLPQFIPANTAIKSKLIEMSLSENALGVIQKDGQANPVYTQDQISKIKSF